MKNTILIILGLGGLFYLLKDKLTPTAQPTPTPTPTPTPGTTPGTTPGKKKPTVKTTKAPILMAPLPPPPYKLNDILKLKLPLLQDMSYELPFGKTIGPIKEGIYLGYSPVFKDWIRLRATYYSGLYNAPNTRDVWVRAKNWTKY